LVTAEVGAATRGPLKFRTSTNLLDLLGVNMYSSVPKAISELVVNGYDADANYVVVTSYPDRIVVEDNGDAMDEQSIREQYMFLGSRHKRRQPMTPRFHRAPIGAKGIGKLAGLGIAKRIEIETWRDGMSYAWTIDRDEMESAAKAGGGEATLDRALIPFAKGRTKATGSGTRVTLKRIRPEVEYDTKKLRQHLAQELPLSSTFQVVVDSQKLKRSDTPGKRISIGVDDPVCGRIEGHIVVARKRVTPPGVVTTVRGRAVGGPSFYDLDVSARRYHSTDFITGQVECAGLDTDDGSTSAIKTDREGFTINHPKYVAFARYMTEQLYRVAKQIEDDNDHRHEEERREKLTEAVRNTTDVLNAWNRDHLRRMQLTALSKVNAHRDEVNGEEVSHPVVNAEDQGGTRPNGPEHPPVPPKDRVPVNVVLGTGRLRIKSQVFDVRVEPLGEDAPECEFRRDQGAVIVNSSHPSYEEALRNRWTDVVVLRAVAARFACDESATSAEAYELLDDILKFAARRSKRRRAGTIDEEDEEVLLPAWAG
jgi:hypothetical protein